MICDLRFTIWFRRATFALLLSALNFQLSTFAQGSLTPPGAPAPTMKSLDQVEPRTIVNAVNTPGDSLALFKITNSGSYYLTGNVNGVSSKSGIFISADNVTLDLNGFAIVGVSGAGTGIYVFPGHANICIRNGAVANWPSSGVSAATTSNSRFEGLRISGNGFKGLFAGENCLVSDCAARGNIDDGMTIGQGSTVRGCVASANGGVGISLAEGCTIKDSTASSNSLSGITTGTAGSVSGCTARTNGLTGILVGGGSIVSQSTAEANAGDGFLATEGSTISSCIARGNGGSGINTYSACTIQNTTALNNAGHGIYPSVNCSVIGCLAINNAGTAISSSSVNTIKDCTVSGNANGISVGSDCVISGCTATGTGTHGIVTGARATITGCTVSSSSSDGIYTSTDCTVTGCSASSNGGAGIAVGSGTTVTGCTSSLNSQDGILAGTACQITLNNCRANGASSTSYAGIRVLGGYNRIDGNQLNFNQGYELSVLPDYNMWVRNSLRGNPMLIVNYNFSNSHNTFGRYQVQSNSGTDTDPWANFVSP
jgi:parallel beta-helix repeat protein